MTQGERPVRTILNKSPYMKIFEQNLLDQSEDDQAIFFACHEGHEGPNY